MDLVYNLPDSELLTQAIACISKESEMITPGFILNCFVPSDTILVIGQSNKPELSIDLGLAAADGVPVIKRPSGGEAVLLSANTFILSFAVMADRIVKSSTAFNWILKRLITALGRQGITGVSHKGISDLAINDKKILGCSIYRRPHLLFYHAVLNISEAPDIIGKYLLHPGREPEYRQNRTHSDFVTSLALCGYETDIDKLKSDLQELCIQDWSELLV